jgi:hypothetical protein
MLMHAAQHHSFRCWYDSTGCKARLLIPAVHRCTGPYGVIVTWLQLWLASIVSGSNHALAHAIPP